MSACLEVFPACAHCFLLSVNFSRLQFTLPLHIFLKEEVLPVEHYIGELPYRLSGNLVGISINLCKSIQKELFINDTP